MACAPSTQQSQLAPATKPTLSVQPAVPPTPKPVATYKAITPLTAAPVRTFRATQQVIDPEKTYRAVLSTSKGEVTLDLNAKASPVAVNNFVFLALNHFYDGTRFHRVMDGFMAQGGDPLSANTADKARWGSGDPGYKFMAELKNGLRFDKAGVLGMARASALDSQGSQFFITTAPADFLSGNYTVFGKVATGQEILNKLLINYNNSGPIAGMDADLLKTVQIFVLE